QRSKVGERRTELQNLRSPELQKTLGNWLFVIEYWTFAFCFFEYPITNIQCPIIKYQDTTMQYIK
ncbi:MAG: hypothetical protein ABFS43_06985, partial [Thermodesulfobacteriota bacterium]